MSGRRERISGAEGFLEIPIMRPVASSSNKSQRRHPAWERKRI